MERRVALVTGASSGIGEAIARVLLEKGYIVYGIGRDFSECSIKEKEFHPIVLDLLETKELFRKLEEIPLKEIAVLVNNAGCAWYGVHEQVSAEAIQAMVRTNLEVPMLLCRKLLPALRRNQGTVFFISSMCATQASPHGAAYAATKAGLTHFARSLLEENRKQGLRVCAISPEMTRSNLYRNADFEASTEEGCALKPEDVASAVNYVLSLEKGIQVPEIELLPQFHRIAKKTGAKM